MFNSFSSDWVPSRSRFNTVKFMAKIPMHPKILSSNKLLFHEHTDIAMETITCNSVDAFICQCACALWLYSFGMVWL